ncbi:hypothetical protein E2F43_18605 [Seongchinamella unica]|uniref:PA2779 family protein n=1 Tax=Seongchinamella unica TaxID=2547392 RepID=A0A4R5LMX1_9GAMM|nr:PA2779 family protein [Seongchinamella unica]TDG11397.1 hypothetical protein E2F43_18605 [Seongchinamella unica]
MKRTLCLLLSVTLLWGGIASTASAAMISTGEAVHAQDRQAQLNTVQRQLARADLQDAMISLGVDPADAQLRVTALSDAELASLSARLDELPAGGSILALVGAVFVVLLILDLTGVTNVFKNI